MMKNAFFKRLPKGQGLALVLIVLVGAALALAVVFWPKPQAEHAQEESGEHAHAVAHQDAEHHGEKSPQAHADGAAHADQEHHAKEEHQEEEGSMVLSAEQLQKAGVQVLQAAPAEIRSALQLPGEVTLNEDRSVRMTPRVAGVVERVAVSQGQSVQAGQVLAVLASPQVAQWRSEAQSAQKRLQLAQANYSREKHLWQEKVSAEQDYLQAQQQKAEAEIAVSSAQAQLSALGAQSTAGLALNQFALRAPFAGVVLEKQLSLGEAVKDDASVFTVADLRQLWVQISVPAQHLAQLRVGQSVRVQADSTGQEAVGKVAFVGSVLGEQTRSASVRVLLDNHDQAWRPGLFVTVAVYTQSVQAAVAVPLAALQTIAGQPSVFVQSPQGWRAQAVQLGVQDAQWVEIKQGLQAGQNYAAQGSFVLKAELGKSEAAHEH